MIDGDLNNYSTAQLVDFLAKSTKELLKLMNEKNKDGALIRNKRKEVQTIQIAIGQRNSSNANKQNFR